MTERIQVLGLCRFSFPATVQAFQVKHESEQAVRDALYSPARLKQRMMWFQHIFLPSVRKQTDQDFTILLLMGDDFPEPFLGQMMALISDISQIVPIFRPSQNHRLLCRELLHAARDPNADIIAEFRPDDDDAFAVDFVEQLRSKMDWVRPMLKQKGAVTLDFQRGFLIKAADDGVSVQAMSAQLWVPAFATYFFPGHKNCVLDYKHHRIFADMPVVSDSSRIMFIRGWHDTNDSRIIIRNARMLNFEPDRIIQLLKDRFDIDLEAFDAAWEGLRKQPGARVAPPIRKQL